MMNKLGSLASSPNCCETAKASKVPADKRVNRPRLNSSPTTLTPANAALALMPSPNPWPEAIDITSVTTKACASVTRMIRSIGPRAIAKTER